MEDNKEELEQENKELVKVDSNDDEEINNATSKKNKVMYALNFVLIIAIFIGLFIYMINVEGIENIQKVLQEADYKWVALGLICLVTMWICESITFHIPFKKIYKDQTMGNSFKVTMIGQLFNNLTPFASGGQLMQAYVLKKEGRRASDAMSVLTMKFVLTQTMLIIFTIIVVLSQFNFFMSIFKDLVWIGIIGIVINIGIVILFFLMGMKKEIILKMMRPLIRFAGKLHIGKFRFIKNPEAKIEKFEDSVSNFSYKFKKMQKQKKVIAWMVVIGLLQSILYYAITYMVYKAFGNSGASFFQIITTQAFLMLIMTIFPTPGAGLGAEGGFYLLFSSIFAGNTINMSIVFWRMYVFYLPIIVGTLFFIPTKKRDKIK